MILQIDFKNPPHPIYCLFYADAVAREDPASSSWLDWPKQVYFIMGNEICERFSFYVMRAILVSPKKFESM